MLRQHDLAEQYFGEGIAIHAGRILQLTLSAHRGFIYDLASFAPLGEFSYPTAGWGLTHDGERLILSDGSERAVGIRRRHLRLAGLGCFEFPQTFLRLGEAEGRPLHQQPFWARREDSRVEVGGRFETLG